jgi:hypothetical protein
MLASISHASVGVYSNFLLCVQKTIEKVAALKLSLADMQRVECSVREGKLFMRALSFYSHISTACDLHLGAQQKFGKNGGAQN